MSRKYSTVNDNYAQPVHKLFVILESEILVSTLEHKPLIDGPKTRDIYPVLKYFNPYHLVFTFQIWLLLMQREP